MKTAANVFTTRVIVSIITGIGVGGFIGGIAGIFIRPMPVGIVMGIMALCALIIFLARMPTLGQEVKTTEECEMAQAAAIPAQARIIGAKQSGHGNGSVYVDLTMDVELPDGRLYRGKVKQFRVKLIDVPRVQPGEVVPVKLDPSRPQFIFAMPTG